MRNDNRKVESIDHGWKVECCKLDLIYVESETLQRQKEFPKIFERILKYERVKTK